MLINSAHSDWLIHCQTVAAGVLFFFEVGAVAHWHSKQFQTIIHNKSNRQADLDPAPLPSVFLPKFSSQTDIGVEIAQSSVRVRN